MDNYYDFVLNQLKQNIELIAYVSNDIPEYDNLVKIVLEQDINAFRYISRAAKKYKEYALYAVSKNGDLLDEVDINEDDGYRKIARIAIKNRASAMSYYTGDDYEGFALKMISFNPLQKLFRKLPVLHRDLSVQILYEDAIPDEEQSLHIYF